MVNATAAAIIAAVCAAAGAFLGTILTILYNHRIDRRKRQREERDSVSKYRDALLRACENLHSRLWHLCDGNVPAKIDEPTLEGEAALGSYIYCHSIYLIGRVFCWTYILHNDIQSLHHTPITNDRVIMDNLYAIERVLEDPFEVGAEEIPFRIYRGFQASIGENMLVRDQHGTERCMGYGEFWKKWTIPNNPGEDHPKASPFKAWFNQIEEGIKQFNELDAKVKEGSLMAIGAKERRSRIVLFQHLLIDLTEALDPCHRRIHDHPRKRYPATENQKLACRCTECAVSRLQQPHARNRLSVRKKKLAHVLQPTYAFELTPHGVMR